MISNKNTYQYPAHSGNTTYSKLLCNNWVVCKHLARQNPNTLYLIGGY